MAGRKQKKLDPRKSIFISEILTGKNGAEAARAAGIEKKNAARQANRWQKDPEVAEEIERGLAAIREGSAVTAETMIRQLDCDRQFAIKTENASAATRASELKAKLVGLMIDRRDTRATVKTDYNSRDTALAIMALFQDEGINFKIGDPLVPALEASGADSWAPVATNVGSEKKKPSSSANGKQDKATNVASEKEWFNDSEKIGTQISIGNQGAKIVPVEVERTGERKFAVYDSYDELHRIHRKRADAEAHALSIGVKK